MMGKRKSCKLSVVASSNNCYPTGLRKNCYLLPSVFILTLGRSGIDAINKSVIDYSIYFMRS